MARAGDELSRLGFETTLGFLQSSTESRDVAGH